MVKDQRIKEDQDRRVAKVVKDSADRDRKAVKEVKDSVARDLTAEIARQDREEPKERRLVSRLRLAKAKRLRLRMPEARVDLNALRELVVSEARVEIIREARAEISEADIVDRDELSTPRTRNRTASSTDTLAVKRLGLSRLIKKTELAKEIGEHQKTNWPRLRLLMKLKERQRNRLKTGARELKRARTLRKKKEKTKKPCRI